MPKTEVLAPVARDAIRTRIVDSIYPPGTRLVERRIADDLQVSRVPVRQALRDLVAEGYAVERRTGGVAVRVYDDDEVAELTEVSAALEGVLVGRLAEGISAADLRPLVTVTAEAEAALATGDTEGAVEVNSRFHEVLATLGQGVAAELLARIAPRLRWLQRQHQDPATMLAEHRSLLDAIASGDADTARAIALAHATTSRQAFKELHAATPAPSGLRDQETS